MLEQVEDDDAAAGDKNPPGLLNGALWVKGVMERLREEDQIDGAVFDGKLFHVAQPVLDVFYAMAQSLLAADLDHFGGAVDGDHFGCSLRQQQRKGALAGAQIGNDHRRHQPQQRLGHALP